MRGIGKFPRLKELRMIFGRKLECSATLGLA